VGGEFSTYWKRKVQKYEKKRAKKDAKSRGKKANKKDKKKAKKVKVESSSSSDITSSNSDPITDTESDSDNGSVYETPKNKTKSGRDRHHSSATKTSSSKRVHKEPTIDF